MTVIPISVANGAIEESVNSYDNPVDWYAVELVGGVDYAAAVFGASNSGGTLQDPLIEVYDSQGFLVDAQDDSLALGLDPFLEFRAPSSGIYYVAVSDAAVFEGQSFEGSYTLALEQAGIPYYPTGIV